MPWWRLTYSSALRSRLTDRRLSGEDARPRAFVLGEPDRLQVHPLREFEVAQPVVQGHERRRDQPHAQSKDGTCAAGQAGYLGRTERHLNLEADASRHEKSANKQIAKDPEHEAEH